MGDVSITDYHAKLYAYQLTRRVNGAETDRITSSIMDSSVDLNPHQIDAALFAFQSPLSNGVLLADEVGLGKTIEAGLVISQLWAERSRSIIVITPSSLRKQWESELRDKFHLPITILEGPSYNAAVRENPRKNPFDQNGESIVICSIPFAAIHEDDIERIPWDLAVIDEAHRLRNSSGKQHLSIKRSLHGRKKLLLTATPLQNRLDELWSLASLIDEHHFGELGAFRRRYSHPLDDSDFANLQERMKPLVQRTLRRDAREFIKFTERIPLTEHFTPSDEELALYEDITEFMRRDVLHALPRRQRHLITLLLHKLLASSTYAIAGALRTMAKRLNRELYELPPVPLEEEFAEEVDEIKAMIEEWEEIVPANEGAQLSGADRIAIQREIDEIERFADRAERIAHNAKVDALKKGLRLALAKTQKLGGQRKALIFTESRRTQEYLYDVLSNDPEFMHGIMLFNGSNSDRASREIYEQWKAKNAGSDRATGSRTADLRAALVDHFRDHATIMIATEAAAEGINLQFCSLVINYDLPWNPQRIEQRIGRCHRYGQKSDVVVLNFLNTENAADQRVYELLDQKFHLFSGVFGSSDEVLGSIGSGADFEYEVARIYQNARTTAEINASFQQIQMDFFDKIESAKEVTERKLFEYFDENVAERFQTRSREVGDALDRNERMLMTLTRHELGDMARFVNDRAFDLQRGLPHLSLLPGRYELAARKAANAQVGHLYRLGHPLGQHVIQRARGRDLVPAHLVLDYSAYRDQGRRLSSIERFLGTSGWLTAHHLEIRMDAGGEDHLLLYAHDEQGNKLDAGQIESLFRLPGRADGDVELDDKTRAILHEGIADARSDTIAQLEDRINAWMDQEQMKLDEWSRDRRENLVGEIDKLDREIERLRREGRTRGGSLRENQARRAEIASMVKRRDDLEDRNRIRRREIEREQEELLDRAYARIHHNSIETPLFTVRWTIT